MARQLSDSRWCPIAAGALLSAGRR